MNPEIQIELLKLADGSRILRLEHLGSGVCLEKKLDGSLSVVRQKQRWLQVFESLLEREALAA